MKLTLLVIFNLLIASIFAQPLNNKNEFTRADTLQGSIGEGRDWRDILKYDIHEQFNIEAKSINGYCAMTYKVLKPGKTMQIDLQAPMQIDSCVFVSSKIKTKYFATEKKLNLMFILFLTQKNKI